MGGEGISLFCVGGFCIGSRHCTNRGVILDILLGSVLFSILRMRTRLEVNVSTTSRYIIWIVDREMAMVA